MARRRQFPALTGDEAIAALRWLVARGQIRVAQVEDALRRRAKLVQEVRARLESLELGHLRLFPGVEDPGGRRAKRKPRKPPSTAQQAAWRAQERYLAAVRRLPKAARVKVRTVREKHGMRAAIAAAKRMGSK